MKSKMGRVSSINYERGTVVVTYPESNTVSPELIVWQGRNKGKKRYNMPEINEVGLCVIVDSSYEGMYIGSGVISDVPLPSIFGKGIDIYEYGDGTKIMYDENKSELTLDSAKNIVINAKNDITINSNSSIKLTSKTIDLAASDKITIDAPIVTSTGTWNILGGLSVGAAISAIGDMVSKGVSFLKHIHSGVTGGNQDTGGPK